MIRPMLCATALALLPLAAHSDTYVLDPGHTEVRFYWDHAGVSEQSGEWQSVTGTAEFDPDDIGGTSIDVSIDVDSLYTGVEALDTHMKSADMFETEAYPAITFRSTAVVQTGPESVEMTGDLTIKDKTLPVVLDVELTHMGAHPVGQFLPYYEGEWLGVRATGRLLRSEYGVGYGAPLTSDLIRLEISAELKAE